MRRMIPQKQIEKIDNLPDVEKSKVGVKQVDFYRVPVQNLDGTANLIFTLDADGYPTLFGEGAGEDQQIGFGLYDGDPIATIASDGEDAWVSVFASEITMDAPTVTITADGKEVAKFSEDGVEMGNLYVLPEGSEEGEPVIGAQEELTICAGDPSLAVTGDEGTSIYLGADIIVLTVNNDNNRGVARIETNAQSDIVLSNYNEGGFELVPEQGGYIKLKNLPTSNPQVAGALWNDNGTLKISSGS